MTRALTVAVACGFLLSGFCSLDEATSQPRRRLTALAVEKGECHEMVAYGKDVSTHCSPQVENSEWSDGRTSFTFTTDDGFVALTFSGDGHRQIHQGADIAIQPVDGMITTVGHKPETLMASGTCKFANPYKGPAPITCSADTSSGHFSGAFLSDGSSPNTKTMGR